MSLKILKAFLGADVVGSVGAFFCYLFFAEKKVKEAACKTNF